MQLTHTKTNTTITKYHKQTNTPINEIILIAPTTGLSAWLPMSCDSSQTSQLATHKRLPSFYEISELRSFERVST